MNKVLKKMVNFDKFRLFSLLSVVLTLIYIFIQQTVLSNNHKQIIELEKQEIKKEVKKEKMIELRNMPEPLPVLPKQKSQKEKKPSVTKNQLKQKKDTKKQKESKKKITKSINKSVRKKVKVVSKNVQFRGKSILAKNNVPQLEGQLNLPFKVYLSLMESVGSKLVVYDMGSNSIKAHLSNGYVYSEFNLSNFSSRSRDVTEDMPLSLRKYYLKIIKDKFGWGGYRFLLMLPNKLEEQFFGTIGLVLKKEGIDINKSDLVRFRYMGNEKHLNINIYEVLTQGKKSTLNKKVVFLR